MIKTIIGVGGMSCQMCEAHINEAVRSVVPDAKTIRANRKTRQVVIVSEGVIDKAALQQAIFCPTSTARTNPKASSSKSKAFSRNIKS